ECDRKTVEERQEPMRQLRLGLGDDEIAELQARLWAPRETQGLRDGDVFAMKTRRRELEGDHAAGLPVGEIRRRQVAESPGRPRSRKDGDPEVVQLRAGCLLQPRCGEARR